MKIFLLSLFLFSSFFIGVTLPATVEAGDLVVCALSEDDTATVWNESAPCTACHTLLMGANIIKWMINAMITIAIAVIFAMGVLYIVSAGNEKMISMAKGGIKAALIGVAVILAAWLIVITIIRMAGATGFFEEYRGTGTFSFTCDTTSNAGTATSTSFGSGSGGSTFGDTSGTTGNLSCANGTCANKSDVAAAVRNNASGVPANILMAIIDAGEGCDKSVSADGFGSCGYSQALPDIRVACGITGSSTSSCNAVQNDVQLDINCAAWLIRSNASRCGMDVRNVASCYNSGRPNNCPNTTSNYCGRVESYYNSCQPSS